MGHSGLVGEVEGWGDVVKFEVRLCEDEVKAFNGDFGVSVNIVESGHHQETPTLPWVPWGALGWGALSSFKHLNCSHSKCRISNINLSSLI